SILTAIYHMLKNGTFHQDLGADYFIDSLKPIMWAGFIFADVACSLAALIRKRGLRLWRDGGRRLNWRLARRVLRRWARLPARERNRRAGSGERGCCWPTRKTHRFLRWGGPWARTIRPSSAVSSGRWPVAQWRRSTIARGPAGRRRSPPRPRHGLSTSPAARPRNSAIP